jgi:hypothetical protein
VLLILNLSGLIFWRPALRCFLKTSLGRSR